MTQVTSKSKTTRNVLLTLDLVLGALFVLTMLVHLTGVAAHEWLSYVFLSLFVVHILFHWEWLSLLPGRIVKMHSGKWRLNVTLDAALYILMCFSIVSGLLASRVSLPALGIPVSEDIFWSATHHQYSNLLFPLVGIHIGLHWPWLRSTISSLLKKTHDITPTVRRGES